MCKQAAAEAGERQEHPTPVPPLSRRPTQESAARTKPPHNAPAPRPPPTSSTSARVTCGAQHSACLWGYGPCPWRWTRARRPRGSRAGCMPSQGRPACRRPSYGQERPFLQPSSLALCAHGRWPGGAPTPGGELCPLGHPRSPPWPKAQGHPDAGGDQQLTGNYPRDRPSESRTLDERGPGQC